MQMFSSVLCTARQSHPGMKISVPQLKICRNRKLVMNMSLNKKKKKRTASGFLLHLQKCSGVSTCTAHQGLKALFNMVFTTIFTLLPCIVSAPCAHPCTNIGRVVHFRVKPDFYSPNTFQQNQVKRALSLNRPFPTSDLHNRVPTVSCSLNQYLLEASPTNTAVELIQY